MKRKTNLIIIAATVVIAFSLGLSKQRTSYYQLKIGNIEALSSDDEGPDPDCLFPCFYGSNGVGTDHSGPQYYDGIKCGTDDFNQLFYYGYPPCGDDITVNYGSSTSTCWQADIS